MQASYQTNTVLNKLIGISKTEYLYDEKGNVTKQLYGIWDLLTDQWTLSSKKESSYDAFDQVVLSVTSEWDNTSGKWNYTDKHNYTYDENGNITSYTFYIWDKGTSTWSSRNRVEYTYDDAGNRTTYSKYRWKSSIKDLDIDQKEFYFFSAHEIKNNPTNTARNLKLYPNPVNEELTIDIENSKDNTCTVFNSQGQIVKNLSVSLGLNIIDMGELPSGLYIVRISSISGIYIERIIKN
jgi:hypothetical protein